MSMGFLASPEQNYEDVAVVTVTTRNYMYRTRALFESIRYLMPGSIGIACCADPFLDASVLNDEYFKIVEAESLGLSRYKQLAFVLNATALCCVLKPHIVKFALRDSRVRRVLYLDNDMGVYRAPNEILKILETKSFVLTPHHINPCRRGTRPNEESLISWGTYNAGMFALKQIKEAADFIDWWANWLLDPRHVEWRWGYDQVWLNYVPVYCPNSCILLDPSYNAAFWNLAERDFRLDKGSFFCGKSPLTIFHFSNFDEACPENLYRPGIRCNYSPTMATKSLARGIAEKWAMSGRDQCVLQGYGYERWDDGEPIVAEDREGIRLRWANLSEELDLWSLRVAFLDRRVDRFLRLGRTIRNTRRVLGKLLDMSPRKIIRRILARRESRYAP